MKKLLYTIAFLFGATFLFSQESENNNTTICWDVSSSMVERNLEKDFSVLEKVFERNGNQQVQLILFGIDTEEKNYTINDGDWSELKESLQNVKYDGATIYSVLKEKIKNTNVYVFTDGQKALSRDVLSLAGKSFLINSSPNRDAKFLERSALLNRSRLMDFATMLPENVEKLQQKTKPEESPPMSTIKGTVYIDNKPAPNVKVTVQGISDSFLTNPSGDFSIPAEVGDTLVVTSRKSKTIKALPIETMSHIKVFMASNTVALDEVIVVEDKLEKLSLVQTGFRLQSKEEIGYAVSEVSDEDITEVTTVIGDAINTKVPGLEIPGQNAWERGAGGLGAATIRGRGTINMNTNALVVVDGVPMKRSETSGTRGVYATTNVNMDYIDPSNIANITVLKGLAATNAYGGEGRGGVILITTKTATVGKGKDGKPIDQALLKNNVYNDSDPQVASGKNATLQALEKSTSVDDAYSTYLALKRFNAGRINFFLDVLDYFKDKDKDIAARVVSNLLEDQPNNLDVLQVVSKAFSTVDDYENVLRVSEEIIKLEPSDVNAYLNRAKAKVNLGKYQEGLNELLALEKGNTYFSVNASGISKTLKREIKNLVGSHKAALNLANVPSEYLSNVKYKVRLVFEWNRPGAEFELQFVNPQKRFFNWEHTNSTSRARLEDELKNNYRVEEYEFYGDVEGEWVINAKYLGDVVKPETTPLVLKTTIYKDFGYPTQQKEDILVHFSKPNEKRNLKNLMVN